MYDDFFAKAHELLDQGEPFATAVVVRADKPTSGKPGDKAIITLSGVMYGWIGGSCAQPTVVTEAQAAIAKDESRLVRITPEPGRDAPRHGVKEVAMACFSGGTLDVYIEPQQPRPRLLIVGHLPTAQSLAHLGKVMSYRVIAVDLETKGSAMSHADHVLTDLGGIAEHVNPLTYVVVASHGHYDEAALEQALATQAPYIGLVASSKRAAPILEALGRRGFENAALERIRAPAGLDLGARRGDEIALSIMAEIVQIRRATEHLEWPVLAPSVTRTRETARAREAGSEPALQDVSPPVTALDPICGMTVKVEGARHTHVHQGTTFAFCCEGCRAKFAASPELYLPREATLESPS